MQSYQATLSRVAEIQSMIGSHRGPSADAAQGGFQQALNLAQMQQGLGSANSGALMGMGAGYGSMNAAGLGNLLGTGMGNLGSGSGIGARMVQLAQGEIGVTESGGNNESARIRTYRQSTAGAESIPGPWCAYFVSWLAQQAGAPIGEGGKGTGYVPTLEAWGKQTGKFFAHGTQAPQPGDIVIFDWSGDGTSDHTGIVEFVDANGKIHTIEGNADDRVKRRTYAGSTNDIRGYVRAG